MVVYVRDVQVACAVEGDAPRAAEPRAGGGAAVAREASLAGAGHRRDGAAGVHLPDALVGAVRDVQVASAVQGYASGAAEPRAGGGAAVAGEARIAVASHRRDGAAGVHLQDALVLGVHDIQVAYVVEGDAPGVAQPRAGQAFIAGHHRDVAHRRRRGRRRPQVFEVSFADPLAYLVLGLGIIAEYPDAAVCRIESGAEVAPVAVSRVIDQLDSACARLEQCGRPQGIRRVRTETSRVIEGWKLDGTRLSK